MVWLVGLLSWRVCKIFYLLYTSTNDSSRHNRWMSIQRPSCFFNLWSSCSSHQIQRRRDRLLLPPVVGCATAQASPLPTTPTAGQAIPLLTHIPPLLWLRRLRVIPFLGLAVVHRAGVLGTAWSTLSTNDNIGRGMYMERLAVGTHMVHGRTQEST